MLFKRQLAYLDSLERSFNDNFKQTISRFDFVIKDYIVNKQLFRQGIDGKGKKLKGYKRTTIRLKLSKNQPTDRTTLLDKGEFYASIKIDAHNDRFEISSDVSYDKYIVKRYGIDILRPTKENMSEFVRAYLLPNLKARINDTVAR